MGGSHLSSSLSYLNSLLCSLGIKPVPPQYMLLAAANHSSATTPVLSFLSDLIVFHLASPPLPDSHSQSRTQDEVVSSRINPKSHARDEKKVQQKNRSQVIRQGALTLDAIDVIPNFNFSQEEMLDFVKFYLAMWGYAPSSPFFTLKIETTESRYLLLALGWLISHCEIFNRALEKRFSVFMGKNTPFVTNRYLETSAVERGRVAMGEAGQYVAKVLAASKRLGEGRARAKAKALGEQVLMLNGRLRMILRSLYALISCKVKRSHELNQMQLEDNVIRPEGLPFSPFQLHLLEHNKTLEKYSVTLEMAKFMIKAIVECNQHETKFWLWMAEVAAEARQQLPQQSSIILDQNDTNSSGAWTTNLSPVLNYFRSELNGFSSIDGITRLQTAPISEGNDNNPAASQVDLLPTPIVAIWKDVQERNIHTSMSCSQTNNEDVVPFIEAFNSLQSHLLPKEAAGKSDLQCLDEKQIKSVKDIATMLVSTLAKIRIRNRTVIEDALKVSMEKNDHFFVGL